MKNKILLLCLLLSSSLFSACASIESGMHSARTQESWKIDASDVPTLVMSNRVVRGDQLVMVHPNVNLSAPPTALFMPFGLSQESQNAKEISQGLSRIIWQEFLSMQTFSTLELAQSQPPYHVSDALALARHKGADFLIGGYITYYFDGAHFADTSISLLVEVYDVKTSNLVWSIAHAGVMPYEQVRDFILMKVQTAMPFDPGYTVTATLANDIARLIKMWTTPTAGRVQESKNKGRAF